MSFFAGLVDLESRANDPIAAYTQSMWKDTVPSPDFKVTTLEGAAHAVRMGTLPSAIHQHGLVPLADPDYPDKSGFVLFSGYLLNQSEILAAVKLQSSARWLQAGSTAPTSIVGAIVADLVTRSSAQSDLTILRELNGIFCFVVWLPGRDKLVLGVDRYGIRPLQYLLRDNRIAFASEVSPLATLLENPRLTGSAVDDLVANRFILGEVTQLDGVRRVCRGQSRLSRQNQHAASTYWDVSNWSVNQSLSDQDYINGQMTVFSRAIGRCREIVTRPVMSLSGGNDSRRILLELIKQGVRPECWTAMQFNARLPVEADAEIAQALCKRFELIHHVVEPLDADWEDRWARYSRTLMEYDTAQHYWLLALLKNLPFDAGWNFDGYGGDFYIYDTFLNKATTSPVPNEQAIISAARRHIAGNITDIFVRMQSDQTVEDRLRAILHGMPQMENTYSQFMANVWSRRRTAHMSQRLMRHKIETVLPYLDNDLVNFSFSFPPSRKVDRNFQREILLQEYPEVMRDIPTLTDVVAAGPNSTLWKTFTRPLPKDLDVRRKRALSRTGHRIIRERLPLPQLHQKTRMAALVFMLASMLGLSKAITMRSCWRLEPIGFLGEMIRFYLQPKRRSTMLAEARRFIYD